MASFHIEYRRKYVAINQVIFEHLTLFIYTQNGILSSSRDTTPLLPQNMVRNTTLLFDLSSYMHRFLPQSLYIVKCLIEWYQIHLVSNGSNHLSIFNILMIIYSCTFWSEGYCSCSRKNSKSFLSFCFLCEKNKNRFP